MPGLSRVGGHGGKGQVPQQRQMEIIAGADQACALQTRCGTGRRQGGSAVRPGPERRCTRACMRAQWRDRRWRGCGRCRSGLRVPCVEGDSPRPKAERCAVHTQGWEVQDRGRTADTYEELSQGHGGRRHHQPARCRLCKFAEDRREVPSVPAMA